nr:hypothetical protein [Tanacetum cinerariifolium]
MQADELYKFSDETLKKVRDELHHRILDFCLGYNDEMSRRKWTTIDKKKSELMVKLIDKQMRERGIIINLERLFGARELEMDYKLMTHITKREQFEKQKIPKYIIKSTNKAALKEYDLESALYQTMHVNKSFNRNPANHALYHALMEALIVDENAMDKGVTNTVKNHKRQHDDDDNDDDEDPSARPNHVVVKRADRQLYKFKEGDFVDLHLNDIKDILLVVQHKLFHLNESDIVDFIVALRMFTRSLIIKRRVKDLQLGVKSFEKKLNITAP